MMTIRKLMGAAAIAGLFLITGCNTASSGETSWTSVQEYVSYQQVLNIYQDEVLRKAIQAHHGQDISEAVLDLALEKDAKFTGLIMKPIGDQMITKASKKDKKEAIATANEAAQVALVDRIYSIVGIMYDEGVITLDEVRTAAEDHNLDPEEIADFFVHGFPNAQALRSNDELGRLIYYLGDSHIDIYQYGIYYESVFYDFRTGDLNGDYFRPA